MWMQWRMRLENDKTRYTYFFGNGFTKKTPIIDICFVAYYLF